MQDITATWTGPTALIILTAVILEEGLLLAPGQPSPDLSRNDGCFERGVSRSCYHYDPPTLLSGGAAHEDEDDEEKGWDGDTDDNDNDHHPAQYRSRLGMWQFLLDIGADVHAVDGMGRTALHHAIRAPPPQRAGSSLGEVMKRNSSGTPAGCRECR